MYIVNSLVRKKVHGLLTMSWFMGRFALMPMVLLHRKYRGQRLAFLPVPGFIRDEENHVHAGTLWSLTKLEVMEGVVVKQRIDRERVFVFFDPLREMDSVKLGDIAEVIGEGEVRREDITLAKHDTGSLRNAVIEMIRIPRYCPLRYLPAVLVVEGEPKCFTYTTAVMYYALKQQLVDELKADLIVAEEYDYPILVAYVDEIAYEFIKAIKVITLWAVQQQIELYAQRLFIEHKLEQEEALA